MDGAGNSVHLAARLHNYMSNLSATGCPESGYIVPTTLAAREQARAGAPADRWSGACVWGRADPAKGKHTGVRVAPRTSMHTRSVGQPDRPDLSASSRAGDTARQAPPGCESSGTDVHATSENPSSTSRRLADSERQYRRAGAVPPETRARPPEGHCGVSASGRSNPAGGAGILDG